MTADAPLVFVVDDDPSVRRSLARLLALAGYGVETFASTGDFLARAPYADRCSLVLDVRLPGSSGLDLQDTLVAAHRGIPIVFITGHGDAAARTRAFQRGATAFLAKPFDAADLLDAVRTAVGRADRAPGAAPAGTPPRHECAASEPAPPRDDA